MKVVIAEIVALWKSNPRWFWILTISLFSILVCTCWGLGVTKQDAAAWVQAVGSIAAIGVSFSIVNRQHERELAQRHTEELKQRVQVASDYAPYPFCVLAWCCWPEAIHN